MRYAIFTLALVVLVGFFPGCKNGSSGGKGSGTEIPDSIAHRKPESTTSGKIKMGCDESLQPIAAQLIQSFIANFPDSDIELIFLPESQLFRYLVEDSVRAIIAARGLNGDEKGRIERHKIKPKQYPLGTGGVAIISNTTNVVTKLSDQQLRDVLTGKITSWSAIDPKAADSPISIIFDNGGSSVVRQIKSQFLNNAELSPKSFAGKTSLEVVKYVSHTPNSLGLIGFEWICDKDDPMVSEILDSVVVMSLEAPDSADLPGEFFKPYQNEIMLNRYPLVRDIQIISREPYTGLGTGFAIFATSDQGQRLMLKAGLVPATMPTRLIKLPVD